MGQRGGLWLFYTVNLVYSESGNTFSPEKEENIFTLYNNDIHKIHCYVKYFILPFFSSIFPIQLKISYRLIIIIKF